MRAGAEEVKVLKGCSSDSEGHWHEALDPAALEQDKLEVSEKPKKPQCFPTRGGCEVRGL